MAILFKEQKLNKWYIKWEIDKTESTFLKFDHNPTDTEIQIEIDKIVSNKLIEQVKNKKIVIITEILEKLRKLSAEYIEYNPTATKIEIINLINNAIQKGEIN